MTNRVAYPLIDVFTLFLANCAAHGISVDSICFDAEDYYRLVVQCFDIMPTQDSFQLMGPLGETLITVSRSNYIPKLSDKAVDDAWERNR